MEEKKVFLKKVTEFDKDGAKGIVSFVLGNGQFVNVNVAEVSAENTYHAAIHGISQRLGDSCSAFSKDKDYASAFANLTALKAQLATKEWNREREGGAGRQVMEDLIASLAKLKKQDAEVVRAVVEKADEATLKKWAANTKVAAEIQALRKARADAAKKESKDSIDDIDLGLDEKE